MDFPELEFYILDSLLVDILGNPPRSGENIRSRA